MHIDREAEKPFDKISGMSYILRHGRSLNMFLERFRKSDGAFIATQFLRDEPALLATLLKNNYESSEGFREEQIIRTLAIEGTFTICLGLPGAGKTCGGVWLSEKLLERGYNVYWFGYSPALAKAYPKIIQTFNLREIENGVLFYDEVLLTLFGRNAATKEVKERVLNFPYIRHHGMAVIMFSQTEQFDITLRNMLTYIWFKPFVISGMFERTMRFKPWVKYLIPQEKHENLLYNVSSNEAMIFKNPLPNRWSNEISKSMAPIKDPDEARTYARLLEEAGISQNDLTAFLSQRNVSPETVADELNLLTCPKCSGLSFMRWGRRDNKQRYKCNSCGHLFTD